MEVGSNAEAITSQLEYVSENPFACSDSMIQICVNAQLPRRTTLVKRGKSSRGLPEVSNAL